MVITKSKRLYKKEVLKRARNSDLWPAFPEPLFLQRLNGSAEMALKKKTREGNIAAVIIYHQLTEEIIKLLIKNSQFFIQLLIYPCQIEFPEIKKPMFGELHKQLAETVEFPRKQSLLNKMRLINEIRIEIAHKLTRRNSLGGIRRLALRAENLHQRIFTSFSHAYDYFFTCFHDLKKDRFLP